MCSSSSAMSLVRAHFSPGAFTPALVPSRLSRLRAGAGPPPRPWSKTEANALVSTCKRSLVISSSTSSSIPFSTRWYGRECGEGSDLNSSSASSYFGVKVDDTSALNGRENDDASEGRKGGGGTERTCRPQMYLHVAPDGDYWTGTSIFAAKHLQPDYVKSIPLPDGFLQADGGGDEEPDYDEKMDELFGGNETVIRWIYDEGRLPPSLLGRICDHEGRDR